MSKYVPPIMRNQGLCTIEENDFSVIEDFKERLIKELEEQKESRHQGILETTYYQMGIEDAIRIIKGMETVERKEYDCR